MKVKRNDPCPCGSGKKYKTCCMNKEQQMDKKVWVEKCNHVHQQLLKYTASLEKPFYQEWKGKYESLGEVFDALYMSWMVTQPLQSGKNAVESFVEAKRKDIDIFIRPLCDEWVKAMFNVYEVEQIEERYIHVLEISNQHEKNIFIPKIRVSEGDFIIGTTYRFDDYDVLTERFVVIPKGQIPSFKEKVLHSPEIINVSSAERFDAFVTFLMEGLQGEKQQNLIVFDSNKEENVAEGITKFLAEESLSISRDYALKVWKGFVLTNEPIIRKPEVFTAALSFIFMQTKDQTITKKEIAERFEISVSSLSKRIKEIDDYMLQELEKFMKTGQSYIFDGENIKDELKQMLATIN